MGIVGWVVLIAGVLLLVRSLFKSSSKARPTGPSRSRRPTAVPEDDDILFCLDPVVSTNGVYAAYAMDHHYEGDRHVPGAVALKDARTGRILFTKSIRRANNPHVTDQGTVLVEDWKDGDALGGTLLAFDLNGNRLWAKSFKANIHDSGMSADGMLAFVSTCNADYEPHSGKTFLLAVPTGKVVWVRDGWGDARFYGNQLMAEVGPPGGEKQVFAFDDRGRLPAAYDEAQRLLAEEQSRGRYWGVLDALKAAMEQRPPDLVRARAALSELNDPEDRIPGKSRAKLIRYHGEIAEAEGNMAVAIARYRQALEMDPRVGIRKRLDSLEAREGQHLG